MQYKYIQVLLQTFKEIMLRIYPPVEWNPKQTIENPRGTGGMKVEGRWRGFLAALINGIKNILFVEIIENNEIVNPD